MKLLAIDLSFPEQTQYIDPDAVGVFMWGRLLTRWPLFAVAEDKTMTPIVLTSAEITEIQQEVNRQFEVLKLREDLVQTRTKLTLAERELERYNQEPMK